MAEALEIARELEEYDGVSWTGAELLAGAIAELEIDAAEEELFMGSSLEVFDDGCPCEDSLERATDGDETSTEVDGLELEDLFCSIDEDDSSLIIDESLNGAAAFSSVQPQK